MPTLLLRGSESLPWLQGETDRVADALPTARVALIGHGHVAMLSAPQLVVDLILGFAHEARPEEGRDGFILGGLDVRRRVEALILSLREVVASYAGRPEVRQDRVGELEDTAPVAVGSRRNDPDQSRPPACLLDPVRLLRAHPVAARASRAGEAEVLQRRRYILKPPR